MRWFPRVFERVLDICQLFFIAAGWIGEVRRAPLSYRALLLLFPNSSAHDTGDELISCQIRLATRSIKCVELVWLKRHCYPVLR